MGAVHDLSAMGAGNFTTVDDQWTYEQYLGWSLVAPPGRGKAERQLNCGAKYDGMFPGAFDIITARVELDGMALDLGFDNLLPAQRRDRFSAYILRVLKGLLADPDKLRPLSQCDAPPEPKAGTALVVLSRATYGEVLPG